LFLLFAKPKDREKILAETPTLHKNWTRVVKKYKESKKNAKIVKNGFARIFFMSKKLLCCFLFVQIIVENLKIFRNYFGTRTRRKEKMLGLGRRDFSKSVLF
jgi:hypothetical protein